MSSVTVKLEGDENLVRTLKVALDTVAGPGGRQASGDSAQAVASRARPLTPTRTGRLVSSIGAAMADGSNSVVYATAPYAVYVHWGTKFMAPRPFLTRALDTEIDPTADRFLKVIDAALAKVRGT